VIFLLEIARVPVPIIARVEDPAAIRQILEH
jgi:hypothetical protein